MMEKKRYFVYYNNGYMETVERIAIIYLHLIEIGVVKFILNVDDNKAHVRNEEGMAKEVTVTHVEGLL